MLNFNYLLSDIDNFLYYLKSEELFNSLEKEYSKFYSLTNKDITIQHDIYCLRSFFKSESVRNKKIEDIEKIDIRLALSELDKRYKKRSGILNSIVSALRKYYNFLIDIYNAKLDLNIFNIKLPKKTFLNPKTFMYNDVSNLLKEEYPKTKTFMERRDLMCVLLYSVTGARRNELLNLTLEDIDLKNKLIYFNITKTNKPRTAFLPNVAIEYIESYMKERNEKIKVKSNAFLINKNGEPATRSMLVNISKKFKEKYNIEFKLHELRKGYISELVKNGVDVNMASKLIGHENVSTTIKHYLVMQSEQFKNAAYKHPAYNNNEAPEEKEEVSIVNFKNISKVF